MPSQTHWLKPKKSLPHGLLLYMTYFHIVVTSEVEHIKQCIIRISLFFTTSLICFAMVLQYISSLSISDLVPALHNLFIHDHRGECTHCKKMSKQIILIMIDFEQFVFEKLRQANTFAFCVTVNKYCLCLLLALVVN